MLAPKPKRLDPELESVREKVRATLRQLRGDVDAGANTDSAFFRLAKRTRMQQQAYTEADLECLPCAAAPEPSDEATQEIPFPRFVEDQE